MLTRSSEQSCHFSSSGTLFFSPFILEDGAMVLTIRIFRGRWLAFTSSRTVLGRGPFSASCLFLDGRPYLQRGMAFS